MIFWRIINDKVYPISEVDELGFEENEGMRIPDDYLDRGQFVIMRGCEGIGDWGIISAMPRLLKEKYPNSKVYVPSKKLLKKLWGNTHNNVEVIYKNNPYVDAFADSVEGDIYLDHYRVYDKQNTEIPLIKQMLRFWQFTDNEMEDYLPEIYWTKDEMDFGDKIIEKYIQNDKKEFGCIMISERFGQDNKTFKQKTYDDHLKKLKKLLSDNDYQYFYWSYKPIKDFNLNIHKALNLRHLNLRIQLYIKSKSKVDIGLQCGPNDSVCRYTKSLMIQRQYPLGGNFLDTIEYH